MRTRGRDCGLLARDDTCELCGQTQVDGGHALRSVALGSLMRHWPANPDRETQRPQLLGLLPAA